MALPSELAKSSLAARSGWGIIPKTFISRLATPAMLATAPLGLDHALTAPDSSQYWNKTWSLS